MLSYAHVTYQPLDNDSVPITNYLLNLQYNNHDNILLSKSSHGVEANR